MPYRLSRLKRPGFVRHNEPYLHKYLERCIHEATECMTYSSSDSQFGNNKVFLKFTPLQNKKPFQGSQLETSKRRINPIGCSHYREQVKVEYLCDRDSIESPLLQKIQSDHSSTTCYAGPTSWQSYFQLGDAIEARKSNGDTVFGMVVCHDLISSIKILSVNGEILFIKKRDISAVFSQMYNNEFLKLHLFKDDNVILNEKVKLHLVTHMKLTILSATALVRKIAPILQARLPRREFGLQGIGLSQALSLIKRQNIVAAEGAVLQLATYFCLTQDIRYTRPLNSYPFVTIALDDYISVFKVMQRLTSDELVEFSKFVSENMGDNITTVACNGERSLISLSSGDPSSKDSNQLLTQFLRFYTVNPESKLVEAIRAIMSTIYPLRDSAEWLTAPSSVSQLLSDIIQHTGSLLSPGSVAWFPKDVTALDVRMNTDIDDDEIISEVELEDDLALQIRSTDYMNSMETDKCINFQQTLNPVLVLTDARDLGVSISTSTKQWTFNIFVPMVGNLLKHDSELDKLLKLRGKTVITACGKLPLFSQELKNNFLFSEGRNIPCLCFSISLEPWDLVTNLFNPSEVKVTTVNVSNPIFLNNIEGLSEKMGWTNMNGEPNIMPTVPNYSAFQKIAEIFENATHRESTIENSKQGLHVYNGRTLTEMINNIRELLQCFLWRRIESGAILDSPLSCKTYERQQLSTEGTLDLGEMAREARLCAGHICGMFAKKKGLVLSFLGQHKLDLNDENGLLNSLLIKRKETGKLSTNDFTLANCFFGKEEVFNEPQVHEGLGIPNFVNVGYPLDDYTQIVTQWRLRDYFERDSQDKRFQRPPFLNKHQWHIKKYFEEELLPQHELLDAFRDRVFNIRQLTKLESQLQTIEGYFIFRCMFIESGQYPDICRAFCDEIGMVVDVLLAPNSKVNLGDRVVCTEIVELSVQNELIVLGF